MWPSISVFHCLLSVAFLFQVVPSFLVVSSCHLLLGHPIDLFLLLGCHYVQRLVHLLSFILATCLAHLHFCFSVYSIMSIIFVLFNDGEFGNISVMEKWLIYRLIYWRKKHGRQTNPFIINKQTPHWPSEELQKLNTVNQCFKLSSIISFQKQTNVTHSILTNLMLPPTATHQQQTTFHWLMFVLFATLNHINKHNNSCQHVNKWILS